jgi:uncharacterized protein (DUF1015 family)
MAQIIPFRGLRYNPEKVHDMSSVVSPPYDRIYEDVRAACYEKNPHNIVRIVKGKKTAADNGENVYTRAAAYLEQWLKEGILVRDDRPSLYVYHQEYTFAEERLVRKGVIALGKLEPEKVHAHERTLKGPKEDRLRLMRATEANFGHIFMLYSDPERKADEALAAAVDGVTPTIEATDDLGNLHRVWPVTDPAVIETVQSALADKDLYIADGHHRYETAVNYMHECEEKGWTEAAPESFGVRMMTLFNIDLPGMSIRPIHRLVHGLSNFDAASFLDKAQEDFEVERFDSFAAWQEAVHAGHARHTFGCYTDGIFAILTLRDEGLMNRLITGDRSTDYKRLDVSILHAAILENLLGIDAAALEEQQNVTYTVDAEHGVAMVDEGKEQILFLLNSTTADEVKRVADHGEKMPQKSTDFYPKLLTGLVLSKMEMKKPS